MLSVKEPPMISARPTMKYQPMSEATNAWIDERMPLRVRNVPKMESAKAAEIREMFQTLSMPLRS